MASKKLYDLAVKTGQYQDREGNTKGRYQTVGAVMQSDDGNKFIMLARWFNPAGIPDFSGKGSDSVLISMFKPNEDGKGGGGQGGGNGGGQQRQQSAPAQRQQQAPKPQDYDDGDIPF